MFIISKKNKNKLNAPPMWKQPTEKNTLFINTELDKLQFTYTMYSDTAVATLCC